LSGSKSDSLGILTDSRPLFNVSKEIYQLAADNINSWFSFLDNQIHKKSNFIAPSEFILEESNWKELRKKGITENEIFSIYEHARAIDGALNRLQKALDSKSIEVFEKNLYFILYNFAFVSGEQYFMKKLKPIVENSHLFKYSTVLNLSKCFFNTDIEAGYEAYLQDPALVIEFIRNNIEIVKNSLGYVNLIESMIPNLKDIGINAPTLELARRYLLSINMTSSIYFIIFYSVLPRYYISFENDQTLNSFIDEVLELDTENPIILIADAFRKMDDDSLNAEVNIKKALKSVILSNIPGKTTSIGYFILALIYQRRLNYRKAEIFFNQSLSYSMPNFLRAIIVLNRGQNRLDNNELLGAKKDFLESLEYPHTEASARTNLGKLYFIQNFLDKAEIELIKALEINPSFAAAYYNLGVLYSQRNDKGRAKKYFQLTLQADSKFVEARNNLEKLEQSTKPLTDWWFEDSSAFKKIVGSLTILLISALFIFAAYQLIIKMQNEFVNSYFIMIVFFIIFLMLPTLAKLKIGPVELDMKSVGSSAH
jgi:tetratricopeptide (TPR) repeat protein